MACPTAATRIGDKNLPRAGGCLRMSMVATVMFLILAAVFYFLAARTYQKDPWSPAV